jgi:hypothetical protein
MLLLWIRSNSLLVAAVKLDTVCGYSSIGMPTLAKRCALACVGIGVGNLGTWEGGRSAGIDPADVRRAFMASCSSSALRWRSEGGNVVGVRLDDVPPPTVSARPYPV